MKTTHFQIFINNFTFHKIKTRERNQNQRRIFKKNQAIFEMRFNFLIQVKQVNKAMSR